MVKTLKIKPSSSLTIPKKTYSLHTRSFDPRLYAVQIFCKIRIVLQTDEELPTVSDPALPGTPVAHYCGLVLVPSVLGYLGV